MNRTAMKMNFATHSTKQEVLSILVRIRESLMKHSWSTASAETMLRALLETHGNTFYIDSLALKSNQHQRLDATLNGIVIATRYVTMVDRQAGVIDRRSLIASVIDFVMTQNDDNEN